VYICIYVYKCNGMYVHVCVCVFASVCVFVCVSDSVLSKVAIFPETREGNVYSSNEFARGSSLREANV